MYVVCVCVCVCEKCKKEGEYEKGGCWKEDRMRRQIVEKDKVEKYMVKKEHIQGLAPKRGSLLPSTEAIFEFAVTDTCMIWKSVKNCFFENIVAQSRDSQVLNKVARQFTRSNTPR